jgi:hypothetical protein
MPSPFGSSQPKTDTVAHATEILKDRPMPRPHVRAERWNYRKAQGTFRSAKLKEPE